MLQRRPAALNGHRLVVGFDGSPLSHLAVDYVAVTTGPDDEVLIVYAYGAGTRGGASAGREHRRSVGQAILDTALSPTGPPLRAHYALELRDEPPGAALAQAAREHNADFIVVGAAGAGSVEGCLGSVPTALLRRGDHPVLVLPREQRAL
jgi:nucleotide-binding universal stress UspA family protein